jgi:hypothetical protein
VQAAPVRVLQVLVRVERVLVVQARAEVQRASRQLVQAEWPRAAASLQLVAAELVEGLARVAAVARVAVVPLVAASPIWIVQQRCPKKARLATAFKARCAATARWIAVAATRCRSGRALPRTALPAAAVARPARVVSRVGLVVGAASASLAAAALPAVVGVGAVRDALALRAGAVRGSRLVHCKYCIDAVLKAHERYKRAA